MECNRCIYCFQCSPTERLENMDCLYLDDLLEGEYWTEMSYRRYVDENSLMTELGEYELFEW